MARTFVRRLPPPFEGAICCLRELGDMGRELRAAGESVHCLNVAAGKRLSLAAAPRLRRWLKENRIAIVHGHSYHANLYGRVAARSLRLPYFSHVHNVYTRRKLHRAWLNRLLARWTTRVICVSEAVARDVRRVDRVPDEKIVVLVNSIDLDEFSPDGPRASIREELGLRPEDRVIGTVGSLTHQKNQGLLLAATAQLAARGLSVHCIICGEGDRREALEERIETLGLQGRAHLLGIRRPIAPVLREMDVFVLPSLYEGVPLALLEAMACGVPAIVSDVPGIARVTGRHHAGVVACMAPEPFAARIESLLRNPRRARALVTQQMETIVPRFGNEEYMKRLVRLYERVLSTTG